MAEERVGVFQVVVWLGTAAPDEWRAHIQWLPDLDGEPDDTWVDRPEEIEAALRGWLQGLVCDATD